MTALMQADNAPAGSAPREWGVYHCGTEVHVCPTTGPAHQIEGPACWCEPVPVNELEVATGRDRGPVYRHNAPQ